ncbi:MAG TPA: PAS domain S-box protein [Methanobacterium sp.]|jgi:PAS domain S-box-containing protein|nr:PAS domain S-box protein [Methanobacterium sp.]HOI40241.1 PAS domain S-box protein [Methanobacterium sp.]
MVATKILVVEDEGLTAMEIQRKLKTWGYDVPSFAFSRKEAVQKAKEIKPDLILMDIMLKGKGDGIDAAQEIKSIRDIPIIYLTAYDDISTRERAETTNPDAYLIKPFEEKELQSKIATALCGHKLEKKFLKTGKELDTDLKDSGLILINFKGEIVYINEFASNLTGFKEHEATYKVLNEVFPIKGIKDDNVGNYLKNIFTKNTIITDKSILKNNHGQDINVEYKINSIKDDNGRFLGAELVFKDISKQLKDEKSLKEREKRFRSIYYQSMLATEIFDAKGKLKDANPACVRLFGAEDLNQLEQFNLFKDFKLESQEVENLNKGLEVNFECKFDFEELLELGFERADKEAICLSLYITPLKMDGIIDGYLVQFQDITQHRRLDESLKNSKERYQQILETLDQAVIAFDNDLKCIYSNKMGKDLIDLKEDVIGKSFQESMKSFWNEELERMCMETFQSGKPSIMVKSLQKNIMPTYIEIKSYKSSEGLIIILNDVTTIKQDEEELRRKESLYRAVVDDQNEIICRFNKDFQLTFANEAYYHLFGFHDKSNYVFSLSEENLDKMKDQFRSFDEENHIKVFEGPLKMSNGVISWWQWVTRVHFDRDGNISEYQSVGRDVTQHHQAMEEIQNNIQELESSIKEKNNELKGLKKSLNREISDKRTKISSMEKLNEEINRKYQEELQKNKEIIENQFNELESFKDRERTLKETLKLLETDLKTKTTEIENSNEVLAAEKGIRIKTEEDLRKKSLDLENQLDKTNSALSIIDNLEKEIEEKEEELIELQNSFETEISQIQDKELKVQKSLQKREKTLKNIYNGVRRDIQMISTLNRLHSEYVTDQIIEKLEDGRSYLRSFGIIHEKLYQSDDFENVNLEEYLKSIVDDITRSHGAKNVDIKLKTNNIALNMETAVPSGLIISELMINAMKHAFPGDKPGEIRVDVENIDKDMIIKVSDNGIGMPPHISVETADSFGLQLVRTFVEQSEGSIEFEGDEGAKFIIKIPIKD